MNPSQRRWRCICAVLAVLCALLVVKTVTRDSGLATRESEEPVDSSQLTVDSPAEARIQDSGARLADGQVRSQEEGEEFRSQKPEVRRQEEPVDSSQLTVDSGTGNPGEGRKLKVESGGTAGIQKPVRQLTDRRQKKSLENRKLEVDSGASKIRDSRIATGDSGSGVPNCQLSTVNCQLVLKPLGYVEKANGQVEAIVEQDGQVFIVHEGEVFAEQFRVLTIARDEVQVAEVRETGFRIRGLAGEDRSRESGARLPDGQVGSPPAGRAGLESEEAVESSQLRVYRATENPSEGRNLRAQAGPGIQRPAASASVPPNANGSREQGERAESGLPAVAVARASRPWPFTVAGKSAEFGLPVRQAGLPALAGLPDPLQPEALGHFDRNSLYANTLTAGSGVAPSAAGADFEAPPSDEADSALDREGDDGGSAATVTLPPPENSGGSQAESELPHQIGYIERAAGQAEAIVAVEGEVHFVREGELFADRFRALSVSRYWTEIEELPMDRPLRVMAALGGGPGPRGQRPPPNQLRPPPRARPPGGLAVAAEVNARAGPIDAVVGPAADAVALKPLGFAVTSDGETVAFVAVGDEVFLARQGETFAGRFRVARVAPMAVEIVPESPRTRLPEPVRASDFRAGKPPSAAASNDSGWASLGLLTTAGTEIPDMAATTSPAELAGGGAEDLTPPGNRGISLHSPARMLDNSRNRR